VRNDLKPAGGFHPQHAGLLVVHLDCVLSQPVLDPHPLVPPLHVANHFGVQVRRQLAAGWNGAAEKAHHVRAEEAGQGMCGR
jgi:hypothetical protein